jgi:flavodoxin
VLARLGFDEEKQVNVTIVYDSIFGNTATIAKAVAGALQDGNDVRLATVQEAATLDLTGTELLIVGSPTRGFRPTPQTSEYVEGLDHVPPGKAAAAFDTRIDLETVNPPPLRWVVDAGGYAATRVASMLERHGFVLKSTAGFMVTGTEGPLKAGEVERATTWAKTLLG